MIKISNDTKGSLYAITSGVLYGLLGYFGVTIMQAHFSLSNMLFWRFIISSLVIAALLVPQISNIKANYRAIFRAFICGAVFYSSSSATYFWASDYIGTGLSMVIFFTYPIIVVLSSWFFNKHKITKIYYVSISTIMLGMLLLIDRAQIKFDLYGILLATISSLTYAAYIIISKKQMSELDPLASSFMVSIGNCFTFLTISILTKSFVIPIGTNVWINILGIGIICTALPILFLLEGMKYISSRKASMFSVSEPVCVMIAGIILLKEQLTLLQLIGVITILTGALIVQFDKIKESN